MKRFVVCFWLCSFFSCVKEEALVTYKPLHTNFKGELAWVQGFGGSGEETAQAIIKTKDGGYAVLGFTNSVDGDLLGKELPVNDYWLLKLDAQGGLEWQKTYGGSKDDRGQSLVQTQDGGFALTGYAMSDDGDGTVNNGFHDNWIIKVDGNGRLQWQSSYGFSGHDHSYDIIETADGGFFFTGFLDITAARSDGFSGKGLRSTRHGVGEFWGTKIDKDGTLQWRSYFGGTNNDRAHAVVQCADGGYVMTGFTESEDFDIQKPKGSYDFWVVKVDTQGQLVWENTFGGTGIDVSHDIVHTPEGGFVVVGNTFSDDGDVLENKGESDVLLIKIDANGNLVWQKTYGGSQFDLAQAVVQSLDGGFLIAGNSKSNDADATKNTGENDIWVLKTNSFGDLVWQQSFGGNGLDFGFDLVENVDGSITVVGETLSNQFLSVATKGKTDLVVFTIK